MGLSLLPVTDKASTAYFDAVTTDCWVLGVGDVVVDWVLLAPAGDAPTGLDPLEVPGVESLDPALDEPGVTAVYDVIGISSSQILLPLISSMSELGSREIEISPADKTVNVTVATGNVPPATGVVEVQSI